MGAASAIGTIVVGIIALIVIIAIIVFFVKLLAPFFVGLIVLAIIIGAGIWIYSRLKTKG
jgi:lipopolysaccharide export LptBFGC system permease protein LptF